MSFLIKPLLSRRFQLLLASFQQRDGHTMHVRKATVAEPALRRIYEALGIDASPGGVQRLTV